MVGGDIEADARAAFEIVANGGIVIIPSTVGYAIVGATPAAIRRSFAAKRRDITKFNAFTGHPALHASLHELDATGREIVRTITDGLDLPLGTVAPFRRDHPLLAKVPEEILAQSTKDGTLAMLMNGGPFLDALGWLSFVHGVPVIGSSANVSMRGVKYAVANIEPEVLAVADRVFDYGLMRWGVYGMSSTMLRVDTRTVVRHGIGFDLIADALVRRFGVVLAPAPG